MLGDVARVQLGAAVDGVAVALNDDRELHCASSGLRIGGGRRRTVRRLRATRSAAVRCDRPSGDGSASWSDSWPRIRVTVGLSGRRIRSGVGPAPMTFAADAAAAAARGGAAGGGCAGRVLPVRRAGPLRRAAARARTARGVPARAPAAAPIAGCVGLGRPALGVRRGSAAGCCAPRSRRLLRCLVDDGALERARAPLVELEPARQRLDAHLQVLDLDARCASSRPRGCASPRSTADPARAARLRARASRSAYIVLSCDWMCSAWISGFGLKNSFRIGCSSLRIKRSGAAVRLEQRRRPRTRSSAARAARTAAARCGTARAGRSGRRAGRGTSRA